MSRGGIGLAGGWAGKVVAVHVLQRAILGGKRRRGRSKEKKSAKKEEEDSGGGGGKADA